MKKSLCLLLFPFLLNGCQTTYTYQEEREGVHYLALRSKERIKGPLICDFHQNNFYFDARNEKITNLSLLSSAFPGGMEFKEVVIGGKTNFVYSCVFNPKALEFNKIQKGSEIVYFFREMYHGKKGELKYKIHGSGFFNN